MIELSFHSDIDVHKVILTAKSRKHPDEI